MPKDKEEKSKDSKKVVVVEEVSSDETKPENSSLDEKPQEVKEVEEEKETTKGEEPVKEESISNVESKDPQSVKVLLWIIIPTALLVGALVGGLITYFSGISKINSGSATPTPEAVVSPTPEATAEPTSDPSLKKSDLKVQVLNGSGVSGAAGKAKTLLEGLGYTDVKTGNAPSSDFAKTTVAIKKTKETYLSLLLKDLEGKYELEAETTTLAASSPFDVVITLGAK